MDDLIGKAVEIDGRMYLVKAIRHDTAYIKTDMRFLTLAPHVGEVLPWFGTVRDGCSRITDGKFYNFDVPTDERKLEYLKARMLCGLGCGPECWCFRMIESTPPAPRKVKMSRESKKKRTEEAAKVMHAEAWASFVTEKESIPPEGVQRPQFGGKDIYEWMPPVPEEVLKLAKWAVSVAPPGLSGRDIGYTVIGSGGCSGEGPDWTNAPYIECSYFQGDTGDVYLWISGLPPTAGMVASSDRITESRAERVAFWGGV